MIKKRLTFPEHVGDVEEWMLAGGLVPLWLVEDWGQGPGYDYLATGVVRCFNACYYYNGMNFL